MEGTKYIGMDVHKDSISIAVLNSSGKLVMESIIETKAITILEFVHGLRGSLHLTFEEGPWAAWLYDLLKPHVTKLPGIDSVTLAALLQIAIATWITHHKQLDAWCLGHPVSHPTLGPLG
jgi:hypothetical protein